jgi:hypothetical protein
MSIVNLEGARQYAVVQSGAYTAAPADVDCSGFRDITGIAVTLDVTAITSAASVSVVVEGVDATSGKAWTIGTIAALTGVGTTTLLIYPSIPTAAVAAGVQTQQGILPDRIRFHVVQGNANATTYSVGLMCAC